MSLNVLIVDDSGVMRKMIRQALGRAGIALGEVREAANGEEALAALARGGVDVALLDLHMPVMTGEELFERIRANPATSKLPVVFVSSESSAARVEKLMERGAAFVHKPWSAEELQTQILSVTEGRRG